jgi:hypothetical protein
MAMRTKRRVVLDRATNGDITVYAASHAPDGGSLT